MQSQPCECILNLKLSRLRTVFTTTCDLLDQQGWKMLSDHLKALNVLDSTDTGAIHQASSLSVASPTKELILRLEQKKSINFSVHALLFYLNSLQMPQFSQIFMMVAPLHKQDCRVRIVNERKRILNEMFSEDSTPTSVPIVRQPYMNGTSSYSAYQAPAHFNPAMFDMQPNPMFPVTPSVVPSNMEIYYPPQVNLSSPFKDPNSQMNSFNNLSDPNKPYLRITGHPKDQTLNCGEILILKCVVESDQANLQYSWRRNGDIVPDQTTKVLMISNVQLSDAGVYICNVICDSFREDSKPARVDIEKGSEFYSDGEEEPENDNSPAELTATAKFALLIANEDYVHNKTLASATNDVATLASTLRDELQFKTVSLVNLNLSEMERAVKVFCHHLIHGAYCVLYLAGHGFENDGQCYIVPTDAPKDYTYSNCFSVKKMITDIITSHDLRLTVVLLDVCRRRNERAVKLPEPTDNSMKSCNFVISFATMESGMAYEVKGRKLGAYVSNLQNHLSKDKRITRVLELVHQDMHKCELTRGLQQPEFKSNMFEDRKLTDPIKSPFSTEKQDIYNTEWDKVHVRVKPILFFFESCGVHIKLNVTRLFSNVLLIEAIIVDKGGTCSCDVSINLTSDSQSQNGSPTSCIRLEDLQRLHTHMKDLPISVNLVYTMDGFVHEESWNDNIDIPFITWWMTE